MLYGCFAFRRVAGLISARDLPGALFHHCLCHGLCTHSYILFFHLPRLFEYRRSHFHPKYILNTSYTSVIPCQHKTVHHQKQKEPYMALCRHSP